MIMFSALDYELGSFRNITESLQFNAVFALKMIGTHGTHEDAAYQISDAEQIIENLKRQGKWLLSGTSLTTITITGSDATRYRAAVQALNESDLY